MIVFKTKVFSLIFHFISTIIHYIFEKVKLFFKYFQYLLSIPHIKK